MSFWLISVLFYTWIITSSLTILFSVDPILPNIIHKPSISFADLRRSIWKRFEKVKSMPTALVFGASLIAYSNLISDRLSALKNMCPILSCLIVAFHPPQHQWTDVVKCTFRRVRSAIEFLLRSNHFRNYFHFSGDNAFFRSTQRVVNWPSEFSCLFRLS